MTDAFYLRAGLVLMEPASPLYSSILHAARRRADPAPALPGWMGMPRLFSPSLNPNQRAAQNFTVRLIWLNSVIQQSPEQAFGYFFSAGLPGFLPALGKFSNFRLARCYVPLHIHELTLSVLETHQSLLR